MLGRQNTHSRATRVWAQYLRVSDGYSNLNRHKYQVLIIF